MMKNDIQKGPLAIAVYAWNDCWRYYKSGILSKENNCPDDHIDHAVALVALVEAGEE